AAEGENFLIRPDLRIQKLGASLKYVFGRGKFSCRAAFLQIEWQKKSAGTCRLGAERYGGFAHEASNLVPAGLLDDPWRNVKTSRFFALGPNAGYAYTLVIKKHFFITASAAANLGLGYATYHGEAGRHTQWAVRPNYFLRSFAGYNSSKIGRASW